MVVTQSGQPLGHAALHVVLGRRSEPESVTALRHHMVDGLVTILEQLLKLPSVMIVLVPSMAVTLCGLVTQGAPSVAEVRLFYISAE